MKLKLSMKVLGAGISCALVLMLAVPLAYVLTPDPGVEPSLSSEFLARSDADLAALVDASDEDYWEDLLKVRLGDRYYPKYLESKASGQESEWAFVKEDPDLPRILIIGDSISRGYTLPVRHELAGTANVVRVPENAGSSRNGLSQLDTWLNRNGRYDIIFVNFGIHDRRMDVNEYRQNIAAITKRLKQHAEKVYWVNTTPIPDAFPKPADYMKPEAYRYYRKYASGLRDDELNENAKLVMTELGVDVLDLDQYVKANAIEQLARDVHFTEPGYQALGHRIAEQSREYLSHRISAVDPSEVSSP